MDCDAPGASRTLVNTGTQMVMDNDPSAVCAIDTPTTTPAAGLSSGPHSPPNLQATTDQALIYTLSHDGSNEDAASPGGPAGSLGSNTAMDSDLEPDAGSVDSPEHALAPIVFSRAGRSARPPVRFMDYAMG
ncbi:unnamed protein product [Lota lota]